MNHYQTILATPLGELLIQASAQGLTYVGFDVEKKHVNAEGENDITTRAKQELSEYFAGERTHFSVPLDVKGTAFQQQVWSSLCKVNFGATASYADIARDINNPKAVRAVGAANGRNPISIIVPCHRVIGSNGTLTGYAGGVERKQWLLAFEKP
ncbi:methylated-DNA--[protein]-cysteine S-methyltransferase [Pseudoalteromonas sp. SSDWG2]|uniref:methylated-DNA--[protein]-cysteine S-methyltransferase n=1 Tax=Pseudoalteromonas sp. SSDWG2 TaxID=3139391 RepID=UPI003BA93513